EVPDRRRILFLCIHNSCRSQMAEGLMRHLGGGRFEAHSAGIERCGVHPFAVRAMAELGIDISGQRSKTIEELEERDFDVVVTTCQEAQEACPRWPGQAEVVHWSLPDPAAAEGPEAERMAAFRQVRDAIAERVKGLLEGCG
ncbi:MAG: arsenate reductase ArsC, partial [Candidatus Brocadiia bacterium]